MRIALCRVLDISLGILGGSLRSVQVCGGAHRSQAETLCGCLIQHGGNALAVSSDGVGVCIG